jgi:histone-lysine N-methyltransferase SETMAR
LRKLAVAIQRKRPNLQNNSASWQRSTTHSASTSRGDCSKGVDCLPHPPYSPDLAPSDFFLFGPLKDFLRGQKFKNDGEVKAAMRSWVRQCNPDFFGDGFAQWKTRWDKCVTRGGDYIEK